MDLESETSRRRTFAIISHPDAGKTTVTEKLLLYGGAIQLAGTVKGRKATRHATSDWMELEKQRGISVTSSVMQFPYRDFVINLLDTPGHEDFSEDTYRTLSAVDSALMVIDCAKGVEARTVKLMEVCRLRDTPIITFINKLDREGRDPISLLDEVEQVLNIKCAPITWPIGMGGRFKGVFHLLENSFYLFDPTRSNLKNDQGTIHKPGDSGLDNKLGMSLDDFMEEIELIQEASHTFDKESFLRGKMCPVFFGSAINNFGIQQLLEALVEFAPGPQDYKTSTRTVFHNEAKLNGFVFKIQANMDPAHRDRIAFLRICSGEYKTGMKLHQVRLKKEIKVNKAITFLASEREQIENAFPGDIIGLHNHGGIQIGDTFTQGEDLKFLGIPSFAPELFRRARLKDPLRLKALQKGLDQLSEEGASQLFKPVNNNDLIVGAVGILQFDVVAYRLKYEYNVDCVFENVNIVTARWVLGDDKKELERFRNKCIDNVAIDSNNSLCYLAPSRVNLDLTIERWPELTFLNTHER